MSRLVKIPNVRTSDPVMLEINLQDPLRRPVSQISPETLADMIALAEVETLPKALLRSLTTFRTRVGNELSNLPEVDMVEFADALAKLDAGRVCEGLRAQLSGEAERRDGKDAAALTALLESAADTEPAPITLGTAAPRIVQGETPAYNPERFPGKRAEPGVKAPRKPRARKAAGPTSASDKATARVNRVDTSRDPQQDAWVKEAAMERLAGKGNGLLETVLVAGLRHRAQSEFPSITPKEITAVLSLLKDEGMVHYSAGRWKAAGARSW